MGFIKIHFIHKIILLFSLVTEISQNLLKAYYKSSQNSELNIEYEHKSLSLITFEQDGKIQVKWQCF